jgi:hypothetical protein
MSNKHLYLCVYTGKKQKNQQLINRKEEGAGSGRITCGMSSSLGSAAADEEKPKRLEVARVIDVYETRCIDQSPHSHGTEGKLGLQQSLT